MARRGRVRPEPGPGDGCSPALIVVGGRIASGKSTLARRLAGSLGAAIVSADETRRELLRAGGTGSLAPDAGDRLYPELLERAGRLLEAGRVVVLDATFPSRRLRARARALAARAGVRFWFVECRAPDRVTHERLRQREAVEPGWLELYRSFLAEWEPVEELPAAEHRRVDTSGRPDRPTAPELALLEEVRRQNG